VSEGEVRDDGEIRALARDVLRPLAEAGPPGRVNRPLVRALGDAGLLGRLFPADLGGSNPSGVSATELCRLREALARECTEAETALALQGLGAEPDGDGRWRLFATEAAQRAVDAAVQIHGARALVAGHPLEHLYREVRAPRIYEGTSEIQRTIIARALLRDMGAGS